MRVVILEVFVPSTVSAHEIIIHLNTEMTRAFREKNISSMDWTTRILSDNDMLEKRTDI